MVVPVVIPVVIVGGMPVVVADVVGVIAVLERDVAAATGMDVRMIAMRGVLVSGSASLCSLTPHSG